MTASRSGFSGPANFASAAVQLANSLGLKDFERSRANLLGVAGTCNRCHQTFRIPVQIKPFDDQLKVNHPR